MRPLFALLFLLIHFPVSAQEAPTPLNVIVHITHGTTSEKIADSVVFLRAARPKGPFEASDPAPQHEWSGVSDEEGIVRFQIPASLSTSGLRLHALTSYGNVTFRSGQEPILDQLQLKIPVYELGQDVDALSFDNVRTIIEIWEDYLVFTQYYTLLNSSENVLDTSSLPGFDKERGMPIELPVKALGPQVNAPGEHAVVNSTVFWKGRIRPQERIPIQVRFSMSIATKDFVYEQRVDYPVRNSEIAMPLQTQFEKLPRLTGVTLAVPDAKMLSGKGILDLRDDMEFLGAEGVSLKPGDSIRFKLDHLPFGKSPMPWIVLGLGLLFAVVIVFLGFREAAANRQDATRSAALESLRKERDLILRQIAELQRMAEELTEGQFETEDLGLRARLAIVLKKMKDFEDAT